MSVACPGFLAGCATGAVFFGDIEFHTLTIMNDCVPIAVHIAAEIPLEAAMRLMSAHGWSPETGMPPIPAWEAMRTAGISVSRFFCPGPHQPRMTVKRFLAGADRTKRYIAMTAVHAFAVVDGTPYNLVNTTPRHVVDLYLVVGT